MPSNNFISIMKPFMNFEPAYILFNFALYISELTDTNLFLQKSCRYNITSEPDIKTPCDNEKAGIDYVATVNSEYGFAGTAITIIFVVFLCVWTDRAAGRQKFSLILLMTLKLMQLIAMCLHSYFWYWPVFLAVITEFLFISGACLRLVSVIYMCSVSSVETRTFRLTLLYVLQIATSMISGGSSGFLLRHLGFLNTYILCSILLLFALIYVVLFVKHAPTHKNSGFLKSMFDFFNVKYVFEAFKLVFRKRNGHERTIISILSGINILVWLTYCGENSVLYLYLRYKFRWDERDYGMYILYKMLGISIGSLICLALNKYLKIRDSAIATFAAFWDILASFGLFLATENWQLYLIPIIDIFHGFTLNACDSLQSQFFKSHEFGRLFSVHISLNILFPFAFPAYNLLFKSTKNSIPGSIFLLSSAVNLIICILYGICHRLMKIPPKRNEIQCTVGLMH